MPDRTSPDNDEVYEEKASVHDIREHRSHRKLPEAPVRGLDLADTPTRDEINARLEAAEARTELRISQLSGLVEIKAAVADHKIDLIASKIDSLVTAISDIKTDGKQTRTTIITFGIGSVLAVFALVVALWVAGINAQGNLISIFEAGLGTRSVVKESTPNLHAGMPTPALSTTPPSK